MEKSGFFVEIINIAERIEYTEITFHPHYMGREQSESDLVYKYYSE